MLALEYNTLIVLLGTTLLGLASGVVGSLTLLRKRALLGDALSHATLPGICLAFLVLGRREFPILLLGAAVTGVLGVALVAFLSRKTRVKEDAAIGIVLSVFFGIGIVLSGVIQRTGSSGAQAGIDSFILGQTAGMILTDVYFISGVALAVLLVVTMLYKELQILCFDADFAAAEGWPVLRLDLLLMVLLTVTTVIGLPAVGVVLMVALLVIPAAAARFWAQRLVPLLSTAAAMGATSGAVGTLLSANSTDLPTGPVIVLCASSLFVISFLFAPERGWVARSLVRRRILRQRNLQRFLRILYRTEEARSQQTWTPVSAFWEQGHLRNRELRVLLRQATQRDWIEVRGDTYRLTDQGRKESARVVRSQRLWELYLLEHADIDRDWMDPDADLIDQILPPDVVQPLEQRLAREGRLPTGGSP